MTAAAKAPRLSTVQRAALEHVFNSPGMSTLAMFNDRTVATLEKRGLIAGRQLSKHTPRRYAITAAGRVTLSRALKADAKAVRNG